MTPPENSPKAQEVKAVRCTAMLRNGQIIGISMISKVATCENEIEVLICPIVKVEFPNDNQPPLAEKSPTTPQLSGQSEGNREKDVVKIKDAMIVEAMRCIVQMQDDVISKDEVDDIILRLGLCVAAMNSQGGKP